MSRQCKVRLERQVARGKALVLGGDLGHGSKASVAKHRAQCIDARQRLIEPVEARSAEPERCEHARGRGFAPNFEHVERSIHDRSDDAVALEHSEGFAHVIVRCRRPGLFRHRIRHLHPLRFAGRVQVHIDDR
jgi:hypothetical protein